MIPNAWSGFNFGLGEEADQLRHSVSSFCRRPHRARADEIDRSNVLSPRPVAGDGRSLVFSA